MAFLRVHQQVGQHVWLIAGIFFQDIERQGAFGLETFSVSEDRGERSRQRVPSGTQSVEPEAEVDCVDRDHRSGYLAADRLPPRICWVIQCQGAPSLKILALIIGLLQDVPQSSD